MTRKAVIPPGPEKPLDDEQLDLLLRRHLARRDAPHHFTLGVMAKVREHAQPAQEPLRLIRPDWLRWGKAVLAAGALMLLLTVASPMLNSQPLQAQGGIYAVQAGMENAFYNLADALMRPTLRLSEFLLGGIQIAP